MKAFIAIALLLSCVSSRALADEDDRARARELADEGGVLYQDGRYAEALDKLDKAYAILKVPTIGYWSARSLEALGRWVSAAERYREVHGLTVPDVGTELHTKAQAEAAEALAALEQRIPRLRIVVVGAEQVSLSVDGVAIATPSQPLRLDPGTHRVVAVRDRDRVEKTVTLEEGREARVELTFIAPPPPRQKGKPRPTRSVTAEPERESSTLQTAAYVSLGVGGALLVAGAATGIALLVENARLESHCIDAECSSTIPGDVRTYNVLRPITTVGLTVGAAGVALGLILLFVPEQENVSFGPGELRVAF
jgi:hypothetical protein